MRPDLRSGKVKRKEIFNCTLKNPFLSAKGGSNCPVNTDERKLVLVSESLRKQASVYESKQTLIRVSNKDG
jgi:hypothetical protein